MALSLSLSFTLPPSFSLGPVQVDGYFSLSYRNPPWALRWASLFARTRILLFSNKTSEGWENRNGEQRTQKRKLSSLKGSPHQNHLFRHSIQLEPKNINNFLSGKEERGDAISVRTLRSPRSRLNENPDSGLQKSLSQELIVPMVIDFIFQISDGYTHDFHVLHKEI